MNGKNYIRHSQGCAVGQRGKSAPAQIITSRRQSVPVPRLGLPCSLPFAGSHRPTDSATSCDDAGTFTTPTGKGGVSRQSPFELPNTFL